MSDYLNKRQKEEVSELISHLPDVFPVKSSNTLIAKNRTLMLDFINKYAWNISTFETGSGAEGLNDKESDSDFMMIAEKAIVQISSKVIEKKYDDQIVFFMDTTNNSPGYTRLKLIHMNERLRYEGKERVYDFISVGSYLSCEQFLESFISEETLKVGLGDARVIRNGPCNTYENVDVFGITARIIGKKCSLDVAPAIPCESWPAKIKKNWLTRRGQARTWPTTELLNKIVQSPCVVVPVCEKGSNNPFEWRISFVLGELQLMWSLNDTQLRVIYILKKWLKTVIKPIALDQLSSYNMKTACFWVIEQTGLSVWTPKNLLYCLDKCLDYLSVCVETKHLPHYINEEANLFRNKLDKNSDIVLKKLKEIKADIVWCALQCCDYTRQFYPVRGNIINSFISLKTQLSLLSVKSEHLCKVGCNYNYLLAILERLVRLRLNSSDNKFTTEIMIELQNKLESNPPDGVDKYFINYTTLFLLLELFRNRTNGDNIDFHTTIQTCTRQLMATNTNTVLAELYFCTAYFQEGNYLQSNAQIQNIWNKVVFYIPRALNYGIVAVFTETGSVTKESCNSYGKNLEEISFIFDMVFMKHDTQSVPYPLKFECATLDEIGQNVLAVINPFIYAHFLQCLNYHKLSDSKAFKSSLKSLHKTVDVHVHCKSYDKFRQGMKVFQRFRAMNLLAYCFTLNGDYKSALKYFGKSIDDTVEISKATGTKVPNAAYYHVALLVYKMFKDGTKIM